VLLFYSQSDAATIDSSADPAVTCGQLVSANYSGGSNGWHPGSRNGWGDGGTW